MNPETLADQLERDPFVPLRLHLADGRAVDVLNPGLCVIERLALYFFNPKPRPTVAEDVQIISLRHIVSVEPLTAVPK